MYVMRNGAYMSLFLHSSQNFVGVSLWVTLCPLLMASRHLPWSLSLPSKYTRPVSVELIGKVLFTDSG